MWHSAEESWAGAAWSFAIHCTGGWLKRSPLEITLCGLFLVLRPNYIGWEKYQSRVNTLIFTYIILIKRRQEVRGEDGALGSHSTCGYNCLWSYSLYCKPAKIYLIPGDSLPAWDLVKLNGSSVLLRTVSLGYKTEDYYQVLLFNLSGGGGGLITTILVATVRENNSSLGKPFYIVCTPSRVNL